MNGRRAAFAAAGLTLAGAGLLLAGRESSPPPGKPPDVSPTAIVARDVSDLRTLAGAHTRVVWVQDVGDGRDVFAGGSRLVLMGFDSDDGRGERPILGEPANYMRPLVTPAGDRIVYSDRLTERVHIINWDGTDRRTLGSGMALATWRDPADGSEWIYVGQDRQDDAFRTVRRFRIGRPEELELVWNHTLVGEEFQVSRDGRRAGGVFPWPDVGMLELPNGRRSSFGWGCWALIAPDDSYRLWYLDESHRNLVLIDTATGESWTVGINGAPGIDGFEVYQPRWSNDARFMAMTGPFREGGGQNRIRGGGEAVEVHVGRFSEDYRRIEAWVRVTDNRRADFYPDVWIDVAGRPAANQSVEAR